MQLLKQLVSVVINLLDGFKSDLSSFRGSESKFRIFIKVFQRRIKRIAGKLELGSDIIIHGNDSVRIFRGKFSDIFL